MAIEPGPKRQPSLATMIVWVLFCFIMSGWAIIGPLILLMRVLSFFVDWADIGANPEEIHRNLSLGAGLGAVGIGFVWLRCRGYLKFGDRD
jgi:hypothetical protein